MYKMRGRLLVVLFCIVTLLGFMNSAETEAVSNVASETPPVDAPVDPVDAPVDPVDAPAPPVDAPAPPVDAPAPSVDAPAPPVDAPVPPVDAPVRGATDDVVPAGEPGVIPARNRLGVGVGGRLPGIPFLTVGVHSGDFAFIGEFGGTSHELFGVNAESRIVLGLVRYRSPIAWQGWAPTVDVGMLLLRSESGGLTIQASGLTGAVGLESGFGGDGPWRMRAELRAARLLDETRWLLGFGLEHRFGLPSGSGSVAGSGGVTGRDRIGGGKPTPGTPVASVRAEGRITGTSLSLSVSGTWSFYVDPVLGVAEFSAQGRAGGEAGSIGFSNPISVYADETSASATFVERGEHEGKSARATVTVSVTRSGLSVHVSASRSDGLSASADLYGTTTVFEAALPQMTP